MALRPRLHGGVCRIALQPPSSKMCFSPVLGPSLCLFFSSGRFGRLLQRAHLPLLNRQPDDVLGYNNKGWDGSHRPLHVQDVPVVLPGRLLSGKLWRSPCHLNRCIYQWRPDSRGQDLHSRVDCCGLTLCDAPLPCEWSSNGC